MTTLLPCTLAAALLGCSLTAHAALVDATFAGTVSAQSNSSFAVGSRVSGEFVFDTVAGRYLSFQVASMPAADGFVSTAAFSPDRYTALYRAQVSPLASAGSLNSTLTLDLEGLNTPWSSASAAALLSDAAQLAANLDRSSSFFSYYSANADGTQIRSLSASVDSLQAVTAAVPEPSSVALLLAGGAVLVWRGGRREKSRRRVGPAIAA